MDSPPPRILFRRLSLLAIVAALGLYSRHRPIGMFLWDKSLGDVCYAAAAFLVLALIFPRARPLMIAAMAMLYCLAIECFKLTGLPERWQGHWPLRVIFGTTFSWQNLACYAAAIAVMAGVEWSAGKSRDAVPIA